MPKAKRNIGQEILEGIRQLKRGEHGRVMRCRRSRPSGKRPVSRNRGSPSCSECPCVLSKNGNRVAGRPRVLPGHCS